jgi:hypothetical protein
MHYNILFKSESGGDVKVSAALGENILPWLKSRNSD